MALDRGVEGGMYSILNTEIGHIVTVCHNVTNILDLTGKKEGTLIFQGRVEGWGNDSNILVPYKIRVISPKHWQDESSVEEIEITIGNFTGIYNGEKITNDPEQQKYVEIYFLHKNINILDEVRKAYNGE